MLFGTVRDASLRTSSRATDRASVTGTPLPNWRFAVDRMGSRCAGRTTNPAGRSPTVMPAGGPSVAVALGRSLPVGVDRLRTVQRRGRPGPREVGRGCVSTPTDH